MSSKILISAQMLLFLTAATFASNDVEITKTDSVETMNKIIKDGTYKQKLFLSMNPNINEKAIEGLLKIEDSIISSTLKDNKSYKEYMLKKTFLENQKQQEIIEKRKTIKFYVKDLKKIKEVMGKFYAATDSELKTFYKRQLLELITKYKDVFYRLDDLDINRFLSQVNISPNTIDFLLSKSKHKEDFVLKKNIIYNKNLSLAEFSKYFKDEKNNFLKYYLEERKTPKPQEDTQQNEREEDKINVENEEKTKTKVILVL